MPHHPKGHSMTKKLEKLPKQKIEEKGDKKFSAIKKPIKKIKDPNTSTRNYNAATGMTHEFIQDDAGNYVTPGYDFKKADQYKANAIKKYGSLEASRKAYASPPPRAGGPSRGPQMKYNAAPQMEHSPLEGHCGPVKMESNKQEKYNLLHDNPVAKHGSWMSKHSKSAFQMGHSPAEMGHESPAKNLGHGMDEMSAEKGAHREYHLKQRMSKKSKDSINK